MYQGPGGMVNRDEYLLGRPIDKYVFEKMEEREAGCSSETGLLPGSIFAPSGANSLLDMASKIREDPLFIIRYCWALEVSQGRLGTAKAVASLAVCLFLLSASPLGLLVVREIL